jgi:polysaccharide biosynthesis/export protein
VNRLLENGREELLWKFRTSCYRVKFHKTGSLRFQVPRKLRALKAVDDWVNILQLFLDRNITKLSIFSWSPLLIAVCLSVSSCGIVPNNGPIAAEVVNASANKGKLEVKSPKYIFDVIDVTQSTAELASRFAPLILSKTFGLGRGGVNPVIGVGDTLRITVFEAGPDGVFSTSDKKSTEFAVTVQPDGRATIPYVGAIKFSGMTIEGIRSTIVGKLKSKAVEPDVIISLAENASRTVTVNGEVGSPSVVPLSLKTEQVLDVLAKSGGPKGAPYETSVTMTRGGKTGTVLLETLISTARENVRVQPGDQFYVSKEPQSFTVLGSTAKSAKIKIDAESVNLVEAVALAGGSNISLADPSNFFIFRYEHEGAIKAIIGEERFHELSKSGIQTDNNGRYPIVYRIDMRKPENYLIGQSFQLRNKDVLYLSRHPSSDLIKFFQLLGVVAGTARSINSL